MWLYLFTLRKRRRQHLRNSKIIVVSVGAVLGCLSSFFFHKQRPEQQLRGLSPTEQQISAVLEESRRVYLYSVIPGGVDSSEELGAKLRADPIAARHYSDFKVDRAVLVYARFDQEKAYVSYRKNDKVFWTRKKVHVKSSEMLLTDGKGFARTRCGNRLSDKPQNPTAASEPSEEALLYVPTFTTNTVIRLPADLEDAQPLPVTPSLVLPGPEAILPFEEIVKPTRLVPLTSAAVTRASIPLGNSPEPGTLLLLTSGCLVLGFSALRRRAVKRKTCLWTEMVTARAINAPPDKDAELGLAGRTYG